MYLAVHPWGSFLHTKMLHDQQGRSWSWNPHHPQFVTWALPCFLSGNTVNIWESWMIMAFAWRLFFESARSEPEAVQVKPEDQFQSLQAYQQSLILPSGRVHVFYLLHHLPMHHTILVIVKPVRSKALSEGYLPAQETFLPSSIQMLSLGTLQRADQSKRDHRVAFKQHRSSPLLAHCCFPNSWSRKALGSAQNILLSSVQVHPPGKNLQHVPVARQELRAVAPFAQC